MKVGISTNYRSSNSDFKFIETRPGITMILLPDSPVYTIVAVSNDFVATSGRKREEVVGRSHFDIFPENPAQVVSSGFNSLLESFNYILNQKVPHSLPITRYDIPDGKGGFLEKYWEIKTAPVLDANGEVEFIIHTSEDVTARIKAQQNEEEHQELIKAYERIEESNNDFKFVSDFVPQMIWVTRPDGYHYYYNKRWYDYTGLTYGETEGEGWNNVFHPDDQIHAWELWRNSLATGEPYEIEYRCRRYDGEYRWVLGRALPLKDESGAILKWFGTCTDIHDQVIESQQLELKVEERTAELQVAIQELKRSNANLEEFAHAASHDLKEPVRKILFFTNQLKEQPDHHSREDLHKALSRIQNATERMRNLIDDLLLYSHVSQRPHDTENVDLNLKVQRVLEDLELDIIEKGAIIEIGRLPNVKGHQRQLQQLFQNLLTNALKYSKEDEPPRIALEARETKENGKAYHVVSVKDNGIGFESEYADKIFHMFTRLHGKDQYSGTGVGLSIVKKVVENHKGIIKVESTPGEGATFSVYLPVD